MKFSFRRLIILLMALCIGSSSYAQNVLYSPYDNFDFHNGDFAVVGMSGGHLYTYRSSSDGFFLDMYNDSMNKIATVVLDFFPQKLYETHFITYPDKMIALYQSVESNKVVQYAALMDDAGRLKKAPVKLQEIKTGLFGPTKNYFSYAISEDKKSIVVYSLTAKGDELAFEGKWVDDNLNVGKRVKAAYKADNDIQHGEVNVANNGTIYMLGYTPVGAQDYADQVWMLSLQPGSTKFEAKEFPLDQLFAANAYVKVDNTKGRVYIGGFYSQKKNGDYDGIMYAYFNVSAGTFESRKMIPFDADMLSAIPGKNKKRAFDNFQTRQLIIKNDGGFVQIAESFFITTRSSYTPGFGYYSSYYSPFASSIIREYHYDDILALSYDANGNREWSALIPKEQYSQEDGGIFSSYALLNTGGTLAFMYNDFNSSHSRIQLATLEPDGKLSMHAFTAEGNDYPDWLPRQGKQVAGRVIVVPCLHKRQICFAKVVF